MKLLIGGSPCTHWSIAQTKNRETEPEGLGWELFKNYLIAQEKFKPDFFLYENNKSMAPAIRAQITRELGVEPILINSALVSAQNRQRLYWTNIPGVEQPEDLGILLRDILESGLPLKEKGYTLKANYANAGAVNGVCGQHFPAPMAAEPVNMTTDGKARCLRATYYKDGIRNLVGNTVDCKTCVAEPVRIGTIESDAKNADFDSQQYRVYSPDGKSVTLCGQGGGVGAKTGLYATPVRVGDMPNAAGEVCGRQSGRIYSVDGKGVPLQARPNGGGADGAATGLYAVPTGMAWRGRGDSSAYEVREDQKANSVTAAGHQSRLVIEAADGKTYPVYEVRDGQITIKGKKYHIKLADGFYIIRKLTVTECKRLQTVPEDYIFPVSDTQAYKMLGNGWTVDVIAHILHYAPGITTAPLEVLSMYDGMSCGHLALDKLGANISHYYATEIDKYAVQTTQHNFPDTIQLGDAFQVRDDGWSLTGLAIEESVATQTEEAVEGKEPDKGHVAAPSIIAERTRGCVLSLSYGKDSMACLGAIEELGWPLDCIIHAEVWATDTIPADLPPMVEFKAKADAIIKERWGIEVQHIRAQKTAESIMHHKRTRGNRIGETVGWPMTKGPRIGCELQKALKVSPMREAQKGKIVYIGIAVDEPGRYNNITGTKKSPLIAAGWTEEQCRQWCEKNGLLSPIYTEATRGGCWFCPNQSIKQLRYLRKHYPEYWALMVKWDKDSPVCFSSNTRTIQDFEKRFQLEDQGLISPDDKVFRWSMLEEPLNFRLF